MGVSLSFVRRAGSVALLLALGCNSPPPPAADAGAIDDAGELPDGRSDASIDAPACAAPDPFPIGDANGAASPLAAPAGEVRAGRIHASELPPDPDELATWRDGDYVLANDRFAFVVSQPGSYEVYDPYGGRVRGMARIEGGALVEPADFNLVMLAVARWVVGADSVTVMSDGSDGGPAVLRARGPMRPIEALGPLLEQTIRADLDGWQGALDYSLSPGDDFVEVSITVRRGSGRSTSIPFVMAAFFQSFRMLSWTEQAAFVPPTMATPYVAFEDQGRDELRVGGDPRGGRRARRALALLLDERLRSLHDARDVGAALQRAPLRAGPLRRRRDRRDERRAARGLARARRGHPHGLGHADEHRCGRHRGRARARDRRDR